MDEAVRHFRTIPAQDHYLPYVMDHVARRSIRPVEGGFGSGSSTRGVFEQFGGSMRGVAFPYLSQVRCRFALLRSEHGLVTADIGRFMYEELGRVTPVIEIPEAGPPRHARPAAAPAHRAANPAGRLGPLRAPTPRPRRTAGWVTADPSG